MRTTPFEDAYAFLVGSSSFHEGAGIQGQLMVVLFWLLLFASVLIAWTTWRRDPTQRTTEHLTTWFMRVLIGVMWFEGSIWKLPLPESGGFAYWVGEIGKYAAFPFLQWLATHVYEPTLPVLNPLVFLVEVAMATSLMLGLGVRLAAVVGMAFAFHLYLGLYRHPAEWPWLFFFLIFVQAFFALHAAGRSLGLDHRLRRTMSAPGGATGAVASLYLRVS